MVIEEAEGFTLAEVVVALALIAALAAGAAEVLARASDATRAARVQTSATLLAAQKMEQLRALTWSDDPDAVGQPASDTTTDLSLEPPGSAGQGLLPSPAGALTRSLAGYADYLDAAGSWVGAGAAAPAGAVYVRRWSIEGLAPDFDRTLVLRVRVESRARPADVVSLVSLKTRKGR